MSDIRHDLVHARDLAQTAAMLAEAASQCTSRSLQDVLESTAKQCLKKANQLLEESA